MSIPSPMRYVDRSGRSLIWVMIHEGKLWHTDRATYDRSDCLIEMCPRSAVGQPRDITSRPCHSEDMVYFRLKDHLHEWLNDQVHNYQLEYRWHDDQLGWCVGFSDASEAVLFKLTWVS